MKWTYKLDNTIDSRKEESEKIRNIYPDRLPVIVEKVPTSTVPDITKKKFLIPEDLSVAQFIYIIRQRIKLEPEMAMFIFIGNIMPAASDTISNLYAKHADEDGFLYVAYGGESTFGA